MRLDPVAAGAADIVDDLAVAAGQFHLVVDRASQGESEVIANWTPAGNDHPTSSPMGLFEASDGSFNLGASGDGNWRRLCNAIGRPELLAALTLAPFMVAGILLAPPLQPFIDRRYRLALHLMSFVAAVLLIARGLT